jgi:hypothetical protein
MQHIERKELDGVHTIVVILRHGNVRFAGARISELVIGGDGWLQNEQVSLVEVVKKETKVGFWGARCGMTVKARLGLRAAKDGTGFWPSCLAKKPWPSEMRPLLKNADMARSKPASKCGNVRECAYL